MILEPPSIAQAILKLVPGSKVTVAEANINKITWHDSNPKNITIEQIQTKYDELKAEYDAQEYARNRQAEYPSVGNQLDMMYWDNKNGTTTHADAVEVVKAKYKKS